MSKYLDRLRAIDAEKHLLHHVSKVAKDPFDTFDTGQGKGFSRNSSDTTPAAASQAAFAYNPIALQAHLPNSHLESNLFAVAASAYQLEKNISEAKQSILAYTALTARAEGEA
jgi:hypothetical protein